MILDRNRGANSLIQMSQLFSCTIIVTRLRLSDPIHATILPSCIAMKDPILMPLSYIAIHVLGKKGFVTERRLTVAHFLKSVLKYFRLLCPRYQRIGLVVDKASMHMSEEVLD